MLQLVRSEVSIVDLVELTVGETDADPIESKETSGEPRFLDRGRTRRRTIFRDASTVLGVLLDQ